MNIPVLGLDVVEERWWHVHVALSASALHPDLYSHHWAQQMLWSPKHKHITGNEQEWLHSDNVCWMKWTVCKQRFVNVYVQSLSSKIHYLIVTTTTTVTMTISTTTIINFVIIAGRLE